MTVATEPKVIGTVEVLVPRIYPLDLAGHCLCESRISTEVAVDPGHYELFQEGDIRYWMMTGKIIENFAFRLGQGLFSLAGDRPSSVEVVFPSVRYDERMWLEDIVNHPITEEGAPSQRLRIHLKDAA